MTKKYQFILDRREECLGMAQDLAGTLQECKVCLVEKDEQISRLVSALTGLLECHPGEGEPGSPVFIARTAISSILK